MNIQQASKQSGLPIKTVRYYDEIELVSAERAENGYRQYSETHIHKLVFLRNARNLGFSLDDCRQLLSLYENKSRASADVKKIATSKIIEMETKLRELEAMKATLSELVDACHGDNRPDCPILRGLGS